MEDKKYKILVAEDDKDIVSVIKLYLENAEYEVITANDGQTALTRIENEKPDLAICDIMMPKLSGYDVIKSVRESDNNIPIIILSAKNQDSDKILGLDMGADDYMTKPFNPLEIVAHVRACLRRFYKLGGSESVSSSLLKVGDIVLDIEKVIVTKNGEDIPLTPTEFKILTLLMKNPGRVFTKVQIYEYVNGEYYESDENSLMVHMSKLRDKIEDDNKNPKYIKTVRGLGYKMERDLT